MIPAEYYEYIYVLFVVSCCFIIGSKYANYTQNRLYDCVREPLEPTILLALVMVLFIGTRPISIMFCDMVGYADAMNSHIFEMIPITWDNNYVFTTLMAFLSRNGFSPRAPILILAAINIIFVVVAVRKIFPNDTLFAFVVILCAFGNYAKLVNGIKAGCAMSIFLCALAYHENKWLSCFFLFLSMGFHHSMQMPIVAYFVSKLIKNPDKQKWFFIIWIFCLIIAIAKIQYFQYFFGSLTDDSGASYLLSTIEDSGFGGRTGFRIDFVLYTSVPVYLGYYTLYKKGIQSAEYNFLLNIYLLTSAVWMLCMYAPYTNRIAEIPWGIYPIVLIYPFLNGNWGTSQYRIVQMIVNGAAIFLLFMSFVYYMFIHIVRIQI